MTRPMTDPRRDPAALGEAWDRRMYRPPSKRRLQVEAWTVMALFFAGWWCFVGGLWMGAKVLASLARMLFGA